MKVRIISFAHLFLICFNHSKNFHVILGLNSFIQRGSLILQLLLSACICQQHDSLSVVLSSCFKLPFKFFRKGRSFLHRNRRENIDIYLSGLHMLKIAEFCCFWHKYYFWRMYEFGCHLKKFFGPNALLCSCSE